MDAGKNMEAVPRGFITEDLTGRFEKFFRTYYNREILRVVHGYPEEKSLWVDFDDLDKYDIALADEVISNPDSTILAAERALKSIDLPVDIPSLRVNVRFYNVPTTSKIMIKEIRSEHMGKFMAVEGIVRKTTDVRPKLVLGAFECQRCGNITRISQESQKLKEPFLCEDCERKGPFKLLVQESTFTDSQKVLIQESLEDLRGGEHPKQLSIYVEDDLTGKISPGDRVELIGTLRAVKKGFKNKRSRVFEIFLDTNSFKPVELDFEEVEITGEDERRIIELSKDPLVYEKIRDSIAPHIYGYAEIKEAIMYQLFSAPPLDLPDGGRVRGDSHIIIMGEPATGKCVSGDTVLCLAKGELIKIKDLIDPIINKNGIQETKDGRGYSELKEPLFVPSINDSLKIINRRVTHVWRRKYTGKILRAITQSGKSIKVTPEHPFFVVRDGLVKAIPADELVPGEFIATPRIFPVIGESQDLNISITPSSANLCDGGALSKCFDNLNAQERLASSDVFWDKVVKIKVEYSSGEYFYDLTVKGSHNFIANGIIVHNSEILQYVAKELAPRGVYASGKGTSAAGLTAAAIKDEFADGGWSLEAGALVLADKGVACIDEFDKMEKDDRGAMHEAMEQQTVSIAKAGILATFRSRCSILAAANPKFGRFDDYRAISEQVNLPPTILSRFDLIFFVRDVLEETREVAKHILHTVVSPDFIAPRLEPEFLRKYIAYARQNVIPVLREDAMERIEQFYVEMRELATKAEDTPIPLTARQLWAILRMARAASRVRLSNETTLEDVERAISLVKISLKQAGLDLETGKVDIDKIMVGVTKSQRDRITHILEIIKEIENEYGTAKKTEVIERAMEEGITEGEAERAIEKLKADGHIYDPRRNDRYKVV